MTQEAFIKALQEGPLTSHEVTDRSGMTQATVLSTAKRLKQKGLIKSEIIKVGKYWVAKYDLTIERPEEDENRCKLNPFDIRNARGIFTEAEYRVMRAQASNQYKGNPQFTTYSKAKPSENNRQV